ncbi:MAG TPA: class I SAM-dependent methyltransferase [Candidatus Angelobacter sp.]
MQAGAKLFPLLAEDIREHYDDFSWVYRLYWGEHIHHGLFPSGNETQRHAQELLLRHCAEMAGLRPGMKVADVGCGHGATARFFARECGCHVLGLTISPVQFKAAVQGARSLSDPAAVNFELADAEQYAFPAASFDLVWNMESSEHFFDKAAYFRKAAAALKVGGRLMLAAWTGSMEHQLIREIAHVFLCPELLTTEQYSAQIQAAGLNVLQTEEIGPLVARTWDLCAAHARLAAPLLPALPEKFRSFAQGIELMRQGFRSGQLNYSIVVAGK